jgi:hypothetical protein
MIFFSVPGLERRSASTLANDPPPTFHPSRLEKI